jgi:HAD superfamily phosphatase (TIGR01668 family)
VNVRPDLRVDRVEQLTARRLAGLDVGGLLLDVDETLLPAAARTPAPETVAWARGLRAAGIRLAIVSNGRPARVAAVADALGIPGRALTGKPWPGAFRRGARAIGLPAERCAMAGDQLFTDVLGARWAGLRTVLVAPLSSGGLLHTRLLRRLEARMLRGGEHGRPVHR